MPILPGNRPVGPDLFKEVTENSLVTDRTDLHDDLPGRRPPFGDRIHQTMSDRPEHGGMEYTDEAVDAAGPDRLLQLELPHLVDGEKVGKGAS